MALPAVRMLVDPPMTGAQNMARDLALMAEGVPTVRLYAWRPACVSLGYAQPDTDVDASVAKELGIDIVRRPTGGGAILHEEDEVTYGVILPRAQAPSDLFASYRYIANGVVQTLKQLGLSTSFVEGHSGRDPLCYLRDEGVSVAFEGRKISGGAQKRTKTMILQHGTILLSRRTDVLARLFRTDASRVEEHVACIHDVRPELHRDDVLEAARRGFQEALDAPIQ